MRSGLPLEYAEYMVRMGSPGNKIVRSHLALSTWRQKGYMGFQTHHTIPSYIVGTDLRESLMSTCFAKCGKGQGDNSSPSLWVAFLYIPARYLASFEIEDSYAVTTVDGDIIIVYETGPDGLVLTLL